MADCKFFDLKLVTPPFESPLTNLIIDLDHLRKKQLYGSTPPFIFFQLKNIFHMLESLSSARIEGNNTTVAEYIETKIESQVTTNSELIEISNMEECLKFIDGNIKNSKINRVFVSELHKLVVANLPSPPKGEGDTNPGSYRTHNVSIINSSHVPPDPLSVAPYMETLFGFVESDDEPKYDLLKVAIAHHRFAWIHPFGNGNGRTVRMFTYAMLVRYGFSVDTHRILNPAAVFCGDRDKYYDTLAIADSGIDKNMLIWCEYVLGGLKSEIEKIDNLLEYDYLKKKILLPAIVFALERKWITPLEMRILRKTIELQSIKASDLTDIVSSHHSSGRSRVIKKLKDKGMLIPLEEGTRTYCIRFSNNYLLRAIINSLDIEGFISI